MIKHISIKNFKSIKNVDLDCSRINIFIGKPNTGKSNILEALGLFSSIRFHNSTSDKQPISKDIIRYEYFMNFFYDNNTNNTATITVDNSRIRISSEQDTYHFLLEHINQINRRKEKAIRISYSDQGDYREFEGTLMGFDDLYPVIKFYRYKQLTEFKAHETKYLLPPLGMNLVNLLRANKKLRTALSDILNPFGFKTYVRPADKKIEIVKLDADLFVGFSLNLTAETIQRLFILIPIILSNNDSILVFEEPETHLFPFYTKYIAENIAIDKSNNQYFISTHNPYMLSSLVEKTPRQDLRVFLTFYEDYETKVHCMTEKQMEEVLDWDNIFFNLDKYLGNENDSI
ncbi:MAG: AAA family ATPase [Candidatus Heimdallarchaeota archaeon]|nr:AAA family ATPase [Candidatus Heimdallarchaeota archaeon]MCK4611528.1 AAA family ATPase [Candidatus Heimdallarchaeota archaeon]